MTSKTISILSYCTIIGWLIAFFGGKDQRDDMSRFHLKQGFGLFLTAFAFGGINRIIGLISPTIAFIIGLLGFIFLILMIIGIINAANETKKPLPLIGSYFTNKFSFI
ncbi:MAG: DUF4870 domain-containing protein [Capnocytophaga sp.]|nr:DUF4870 domain-containing protein [Capnocytophaga sp.]